MRNNILLIYAALKQSPFASFLVGGSLVQTFIETSMPVLQWLLAFAGLVFTVYQIRLKRRQLMAMNDKIVEVAP